jgi:hypothetical protein
MNLAGKHIYITGSNRGMGLDFAKKAAENKAHVYLVNRSNINPKDMVAIKALGAASITEISLDLLDTNAIDQFLLGIANQPVDVFINNSGLLTGGLIEKQNMEDIDKMLNVNLHALIRLTRGLIPQMIAQGSGYIVNNSSVSGKMFFPCASTYAASKAGVVAFTQSVSQELAETGVKTLLLITPGVKTSMYEDISNLYGENLDLSFMSSIPASEWAEQVFTCLKNDESICYPKGASRIGVWIGHHMPKVMRSVLKGKFKR